MSGVDAAIICLFQKLNEDEKRSFLAAFEAAIGQQSASTKQQEGKSTDDGTRSAGIAQQIDV